YAVHTYNIPANTHSNYVPYSSSHTTNVYNEVTVMSKAGKNPVLAHLLADCVFSAKQSLANFTNTTGYQMAVKSMTPESMVQSGLVPDHLSTVIVSTDEFAEGWGRLGLATAVVALC